MSKSAHRVGLVGAGRIAAVHSGFIRGISGAEVVAVCDADTALAESFAGERNIPNHYSSLDEMMVREEPNIVHVCTPPATHANIAISAMEQGANVFVEKPMAMSVEDCDRMIDAAERYGRRICVDHNRLLDPVMQKVRALVANGALGEIVSVEAHQGVNPPEKDADGHWSVADAFAPLYNLGPHPLYLVEAFAGPAREIIVQGVRIPSNGVLREIRILLPGENCDAFVSFSMGAQPYLNHLDVYGTKATARVNLNTMTVVVDRERKLPKMVAKLLANLEPAAQMVQATVSNTLAVALRRMKTYPGIGNTIRAYYRSLDEGAMPPNDGASGRENVRVLRAIEDALRDDGAIQSRKGESKWTS
ncbi:MAG: Gfo/Idh/MocA family oxidoreductase [Deltaproteobacteria bacterium]